MPRQEYVFVNSREALWETSSYEPVTSSRSLQIKLRDRAPLLELAVRYVSATQYYVGEHRSRC
ncbi:hypothetical protein SAMN05444158_3952 [Bradyrhizobium canariense]|uniref:Uncharacterized protein n=1 Tax=Bradyrhizobium canariense TaxID=255045 RepID=A0A1H1WPV5_9BRAD|nr:hypothetical protein SAMN05444158_3952 [Bradyrhizobium canariense]